MLIKTVLSIVLLTCVVDQVYAQSREEKLKPLLKDAVFALSNVMMHDVVSPVIASRYYMYCTIGSNAIISSSGKTIHPSKYIKHFPITIGNNILKDPSLAALFAIYETGMAILPSGLDMLNDYESVKKKGWIFKIQPSRNSSSLRLRKKGFK